MPRYSCSVQYSTTPSPDPRSWYRAGRHRCPVTWAHCRRGDTRRPRGALVIYLDTSAFLKLYVREAGSEFVQHCLESQDYPVPIPDILRCEFLNALRLKAYWNELDDSTVDRLLTLFDDRLLRGQYAVVEIDGSRRISDFRQLSAHTVSLGCRTLDILHVATALQLRPRRFITFDQRRRSLAVAAGLAVEPAPKS